MREGIQQGTFAYTWSFPICPHKVSIDLSVVEALQQELSDHHQARQGLLLGQIGPGLTQIDEYLPVPALDHDSFRAALAAEARQVVGYYNMRDGSAFMLAPAEVAIAQEFFGRQGPVVLLVERRKRGPAEAAFFFWRRDVFVHNLPLPFPFHAGLLSGETAAGTTVTPPVRASNPGRALRRFVFLLGTAMATAALFFFYLKSGPRQAPRATSVSVGPVSDGSVWIATQPKRDLELSWDARIEPVSTATAGVLKIEDGGVTRQMSLDVGELLLGTILYAPGSDRIRVELTTLQRDGRMTGAVVRAQPAETTYSTPVAGAGSQLPPASKHELLAEAGKTVAPAEKKSAPEPVVAIQRPPLRRFTWTSADRAVPQAPIVADAAHQAPPPVTPAVLTATLPAVNLPGATVAPPPPPRATPAPAAAPVRSAPHAGRLIWTGSLLRRGVVELDGRAVSVGALSGVLPGVPVNLTITPAEFGEDGLMVYTTDAKQHNRVEPPSASNGWNKLTFVWDPERVRQLAVLESPNASNGFNRLALRSDARRCSMIFIDWTTRQ